METDSRNSGNNNGCVSMYGGKDPEGARISPGSSMWRRARGSTLREDFKYADEGKMIFCPRVGNNWAGQSTLR
jgi:hypothetical protein